LEIGVCVASQLQSKIIVNTLEEKTLLICIFPHLIRRIARQLGELIMILADSHRSHPEGPKFLLFELYYSIWNVMCLEVSDKLLPGDGRSIVGTCGLIRFLPGLSCPL
jgi:hypothetical protein